MILEEAERHGRAVNEDAERTAAATLRAAEEEVERIAADAREAARSAASERVERLAELQSALTVRGPAVLDGLEGSGLTRARLEALIRALAATAERVMDEAQRGDPREAAAPEAEPAAGTETEEAESEAAATSPDDPEPGTAAASPKDPVAAAEGLAQPVNGGESPDEASPGGDSAEDDSQDPAVADGNGDGSSADPTQYEGPLPEGAPIARRPLRTRERDARFAALLLAVKGRERGVVEDYLRREYGFADCEPILDEVFGRTPA